MTESDLPALAADWLYWKSPEDSAARQALRYASERE